MFEQTFKNIDDVLWKEAGCATEQTSWLLFLKYLDEQKDAADSRCCVAAKRGTIKKMDD
jgi:type I restriction enzyme M protein